MVLGLVRGGFPDSSVGKESTCNAADPSSIPGWGRSTEEGIGYPLQYSCKEKKKEMKEGKNEQRKTNKVAKIIKKIQVQN